jgi:thiamine biosynthesis lipoprotein
MASPCEILLEPPDKALCHRLTELAAAEAVRIEQKYSRYRPDSVLSRMNANNGSWQTLDSETAQLLAFAQQCYQLSDGLFDISSGILRRVWQFDGSDNIASQADIAAGNWSKITETARRLLARA